MSAPSGGGAFGTWEANRKWSKCDISHPCTPDLSFIEFTPERTNLKKSPLCFTPWNSQTGFTREFSPKQWVFTFTKWSERSVLLQHAKKYRLCSHHFIKCECQILYSFKLAARSCNSSVCLFKKKKKSRAFSLCLFKLHLIRAPICPSLIAFQILKKNDNSFCQL